MRNSFLTAVSREKIKYYFSPISTSVKCQSNILLLHSFRFVAKTIFRISRTAAADINYEGAASN